MRRSARRSVVRPALAPLVACALLVGPALAAPTPAEALVPLVPLVPAEAIAPLVPAEARWVVHLDVQAVLASDLLATLSTMEGGVHVDLEGLDEIEAELGLDPREHLRGVTVYGSSVDPEQAVALIHTDEAVEGLIGMVGASMQASVQALGDVELRRWEDGGDVLFTYLARRGAGGERILLVSQQAEALAQGVRVLRGESAHAGTDSELARLQPREGAFLFVCASGVLDALAEHEPSAAGVARLVRGLVLEAGESGGRTFLALDLTTDGSDEARQIAQVVQGAGALVQLVAQSHPEARELAPLLGGLRVEAGETSVRLAFEQDTATLLAMLRDASDHDDDEEDVRAFQRPRGADDQRWY